MKPVEEEASHPTEGLTGPAGTQVASGASRQVSGAVPAQVAGFPAIVGQPSASQRGASRPGAGGPGDRPGEGRPPVLLVHGAFADEHCFAGWAARLAKAGYHTCAPARRGRHGIGPDRAAGLTFADYVADTLAVIDELGEPPVIVGHSLGGLIAQRVAELGRAAAIVLLAPAPPSMLTAQAVALPRFGPLLPRILAGRPFIVGNDACSVLALNQMPAHERAAVHAHLTPESGAVYRSMLLGTVRIDSSQVTVPVYVTGGDEDRIISTRLLRRTARHYGVEAHVLAGRGHWLIEEPGWEALADDVVAWLARVLPARV